MSPTSPKNRIVTPHTTYHPPVHSPTPPRKLTRSPPTKPHTFSKSRQRSTERKIKYQSGDMQNVVWSDICKKKRWKKERERGVGVRAQR
ncbi:predicted protein [Plenodomus lingam JN3]|uniref:Predicted protein n=1 Tax=Leptosphaeria maculans (strain JN3 / isolate v23.1.3 / race Av1-4-5-6-7-8) TaxID=985895 RepID=E5ADP5_LEPMJ|nr:predicted protein [Plenodomus lingam JN3]CBY01334.1 predicted protein [Plenodomus lingam JN3]